MLLHRAFVSFQTGQRIGLRVSSWGVPDVGQPFAFLASLDFQRSSADHLATGNPL